jgi:hypothetical protein
MGIVIAAFHRGLRRMLEGSPGVGRAFGFCAGLCLIES